VCAVRPERVWWPAWDGPAHGRFQLAGPGPHNTLVACTEVVTTPRAVTVAQLLRAHWRWSHGEDFTSTTPSERGACQRILVGGGSPYRRHGGSLSRQRHSGEPTWRRPAAMRRCMARDRDRGVWRWASPNKQCIFYLFKLFSNGFKFKMITEGLLLLKKI
jgi:hypothetical protein